MPFTPGSRFDRYEILKPLGAGGMGEVYLARDLRLDRKVALKLLPLAYTHDAERVRRFEQEARAVSALNHPNIITIYEVGEVAGDAGRTHFIATEFVEGQTLRQRLKHGPVHPAEAVEIALQTAGALNAAHSAGVLHRDIKPENIMLRPDGYVKVLDFGLAKLTERRRGDGATGRRGEEEEQEDKWAMGQGEASDGIAPSPRRPVAPSPQHILTDPGMVLGTANYMSPEQARGQQLDGRSDIFSLGIVLYEMLAGRSPFHDQTPTDVMAAILQREPPRLMHVADDITPALERIVHKMLAKDRAARYASSLELRADLLSLRRGESASAGLPGAPASSGAHESQSRTSDRIASAFDGTSSRGGNRHDGRDTAPRANAARAPWPSLPPGVDAQSYETRTDSATPTVASAAPVEHTSAAVILAELKKHKRGVAYALAALCLLAGVAGYGLYRWLAGRGRDNFPDMRLTRLATTNQVGNAIVSPDGKYVAYLASEGEGTGLWVKQTSASGNPLRLVTAGDAAYRAPTFSRDGNYIFYVVRSERSGGGELFSLPTLGGASRHLASGVSGAVAASSDGTRLAFVRELPAEGASALIVCGTDGNGAREVARRKLPLAFSIEGPAWSPDDRWIACGTTDFSRGVVQNIAAVSVADGSEQPLTDRAWANIGRVVWLPDGQALAMIAREPAAQTRQIWLVEYPSKRLRRITNDLSEYRGLTVTDDGATLASIQINQISNIWIADAGNLNAGRQLTSSATNGGDGMQGLAWLADDQLVYAASAAGKTHLWLTDAGGAPPRQLTFQDNNNFCAAGADGRTILFNSDRDGAVRVWRMNPNGGDLRALTDGRLDLDPQATPDGQWIIFSSIRSGKRTLWRVPSDGGDPVQITDALSEFPQVSPDGKLIACSYRDSASARPRIVTLPIEGGPPVRAFEMPTSPWRLTHWSPDGRALVYVITKNGVSNLWSQPVVGGAPRQLTDFRSDHIFGFAWSRDGKRLAYARGAETRDVVLIGNFR